MSPRSLPSFVCAFLVVILVGAWLAGCTTTSSTTNAYAAPGARLIGTWEQTSDDMVSQMSSARPRMTFKEDGTLELVVVVSGQTVRQDSTWKLVEDTPPMIRITTASATIPDGQARIYFVDADSIKIGVAQSTTDFLHWKRVK